MKKPLLFLSLILVLASGCDRLPWGKKSAGEPSTEAKKGELPFTVPWKGQALAADTFIKIARTADLAVVNISTTKTFKRARSPRPFFSQPEPFGDPFGGDFFRRFFGEMPDTPEYEQRSLGSGFVLTEDGYVATNNHVVEKADEIKVTIGKDQEYKATLVGADPKTDVALLKIKPKERLQTLALGDSDQLQVGEIVMAIGNPFGLSHTVTQGIVSAKERAIGFGQYDNFIQTDASINPGNSGGPLLNLKAEVVGINAAIVASGQGIGFAIPINLAKNILMQIKDTGKVTRGWLGVYIQQVDMDLAKSLGLKERRGALVSNVQSGSPAEQAGIKRGDVIVKFGEKEIADFNELPRFVAVTPIGTKVRVEILREGKKVVVEPTIKELKPEKEEAQAEGGGEDEAQPSKEDLLGLSVGNLTPQISRQLQLEPEVKGVFVANVKANAAAADKGIQRGDMIVEVNKHKVSDVDEYRKYTKSLKKGDTVLLLLRRGGGATLFVAFTL
ncbi:MAG: Do family serine endopeptidase [Pseudomonadota bacterium]